MKDLDLGLPVFRAGAAIWLLLYSCWLPHVYGGGHVVGDARSWLAVLALGLVIGCLSYLGLSAYGSALTRPRDQFKAATIGIGAVTLVLGAAVLAAFMALLALLLLPPKVTWWVDRNLGLVVILVMATIGLTALTTYLYRDARSDGMSERLSEVARIAMAPFAILVFATSHSVFLVFFITRASEASGLARATVWLDSNFRLGVFLTMSTAALATVITYISRRSNWKGTARTLFGVAGTVIIALGSMVFLAQFVFPLIEIFRAIAVLFG